MTTDVVQLPHTGPDRVGQGTAIEQTRAAAEVYYRLSAAKQFPRDETAATERMRAACLNPMLAEKAFYAVPKGNDKAVGPSVHLARELARIWGNLDYGIVELRRDDDYHQSELQAFALDLETNTRPSTLWIQPHKMDTKRGVKQLVEVQAIYELNSNAGARRVREQIFAVLPKAFVDEAQALCRATLARGDGKPIEQRRAAVVAAFAKAFNVTEPELVARMGRAVERWDDMDVSELEILGRSMKAGEVKRDEEFPPAAVAVTAEEIAPKAAAKAAAPEPAAETEDEARAREQLEMEAEIAAAEGDTAGDS